MDGMGDLEDAPLPPMGADDNGMVDGMDEIPNDMGMEPPMDNEMSGDEPNGNGSLEDDELMNIINNLSIEDKAAVTKYAKSMADDSNNNEEMPQDQSIPMESRKSLKQIIDETLNDVLDNKGGTKRGEKKAPKEYRGKNMPFKSKFQS